MIRADDRTQRMIDETSAFLTWALSSNVSLPRIPRQSVDQGGFSQLIRLPGAKAAMARWWDMALERISQSSN